MNLVRLTRVAGALGVFPTRVGMNRLSGQIELQGRVFPTRVGMNRGFRRWHSGKLSIPHTRGDEPMTLAYKTVEAAYSPHAWG